MKPLIIFFAVILLPLFPAVSQAEDCSFKRLEALATQNGQFDVVTQAAWQTVQTICIEHGQKSQICDSAAKFWHKLFIQLPPKDSLETQLQTLPPDSAACVAGGGPVAI